MLKRMVRRKARRTLHFLPHITPRSLRCGSSAENSLLNVGGAVPAATPEGLITEHDRCAGVSGHARAPTYKPICLSLRDRRSLRCHTIGSQCFPLVNGFVHRVEVGTRARVNDI